MRACGNANIVPIKMRLVCAPLPPGHHDTDAWQNAVFVLLLSREGCRERISLLDGDLHCELKRGCGREDAVSRYCRRCCRDNGETIGEEPMKRLRAH